MYVYVSKKNLLKKCSKASSRELDILCELKEIDLDSHAFNWADASYYASYDGLVKLNDDAGCLSEFIDAQLGEIK